MAKFEFGFEESWLRLIIKRLPKHPDLFQSNEAAVERAQSLLRIGKLKVGAARVWAESAGLIQKNKKEYGLSPLGELIATHDPEFEEDGIWWALHYNLAREQSPAWFYAYYANLFEPDEFTREELKSAIHRYREVADTVMNKLVLAPLQQVFEGSRLGEDFRLYYPKDSGYARRPVGNPPVHPAIFSYALCDWARQNQRKTAHIEVLLDTWSPGRIFRMDREAVDQMLVDIGERYQKNVAWISHTANLNSVSLPNLPPLAMLLAYYLELDGKEPMDALRTALKQIGEESRDGDIN